MKITVVVDNKDSWMISYAKRLTAYFNRRGHTAKFTHNYTEIQKGDCAFFLSCEKIVGKKILKLNKHNIVVHASALPDGRGWSPLAWQILGGKNEIPVTLFEAAEKVDSGQIYLQDKLKFEGHELLYEMQDSLGKKITKMCLLFIALLDKYGKVKGRLQRGRPTFYPRRTPRDSALDTDKTLKQLFNQLRIVDNKRYPAFFYYRGHKYIFSIRKDNADEK